MHITKVRMKDGTEHKGILWKFRPQEGFMYGDPPCWKCAAGYRIAGLESGG